MRERTTLPKHSRLIFRLLGREVKCTQEYAGTLARWNLTRCQLAHAWFDWARKSAIHTVIHSMSTTCEGVGQTCWTCFVNILHDNIQQVLCEGNSTKIG